MSEHTVRGLELQAARELGDVIQSLTQAVLHLARGGHPASVDIYMNGARAGMSRATRLVSDAERARAGDNRMDSERPGLSVKLGAFGVPMVEVKWRDRTDQARSEHEPS